MIMDSSGKTAFPSLPQYRDREIYSFCKNVSVNKAQTFDGVSDLLFDFRYLCKCKESLTCKTCINRILVLCNFLDYDYYSSTCSKWEVHFEARLIALNKKFPAILNHDEYRPIVVTSSLIKFV